MDAEFFRVLVPSTTKKPSHLSFTALDEIESCAARWILSHGEYAEIASLYPRKPVGAAIKGRIVHLALEQFGAALSKAGNPRPNSETYVSVRKEFPVRTVIKKERERLFKVLAGNPRANVPLLERQVEVDSCVNMFKRLRERCTVANAAANEESAAAQDRLIPKSTHKMPGAAVPGQLFERTIQLADPPISGRVDLVMTSDRGDSIFDYKTGKQQPKHVGQVDFYALLWARSSRRGIIERSIIYSDGNRIDLGALSADELDDIERSYSRRVSLAMHAIGSAPIAKPDCEKCVQCDVRQLCNPYWKSSTTDNLRWHIAEAEDAGPAEWKDLELHLNECTLSGSVLSARFVGDGQTLSLQCVIPQRFMKAKWRADNSLRLLGVLLRQHDSAIQVVWGTNSEAYWL